MKKTYVFALFFVVCLSSFAQQPTDSISIKKVLGGYQFRQANELLKMNQLVYRLKSNDEAYSQIKGASTNYTIATILSATGGFLVGYPIGVAMGGGKPNWTMAAVGAGLIVVAIPISKKSNKQAIKAVKTYNTSLFASSSKPKNEFFLTFSENGVGLKVRF
ncbi:MAG: hypothetical protein ACJAUV_000225 [Flavobacteriales bacterium]|jgi:hypothetical protein